MKTLILGASGMLGHALASSLVDKHQVAGTVRDAASAALVKSRVSSIAIYQDVDVRSFETVTAVIDEFQPDAVINAVGIIKQRPESTSAIECLEVNALLPHHLSTYCIGRRIRLIHISTDCVFSGNKGNYSDDAFADADDLYGRTKYLGEVAGSRVVTLRSSLIGLELTGQRSLIEWFLSQEKAVDGYRKAIFSGLTTREMANVIDLVLATDSPAGGVYNVSSEPIDKFSLLVGLRDRLGIDIAIHPNDMYRCDRSLDSTRFRATFGYRPPSWADMLDELADEVRMRV